jgi:hypothetical protein
MKEYPKLNTTPIQHRSINSAVSENSIPSSHELALIQQELKVRMEGNIAGLDQCNGNKKELEKWMSKHKEKEKVIATVAQDGVQVSLTSNGTIHITNPKGLKNVEDLKKTNHRKSNVQRAESISRQEESVRSTPDVERPSGDYSKLKAQQNQIPISSFWTFMDQYFRPLNVEDLETLESNGDEVSPYLIPKGKHYKTRWEEEDVKWKEMGEYFAAGLNKEYAETDECIVEGDINLGPFSERLIGSFIRDAVVPGELDEQIMKPRPRTRQELQLYEDRVKEELMCIGLIPHPSERLDNEIVNALQAAQTELRDQVRINRGRKRILRGIAEEYMAYQEYQNVLGEINKAVDSAYTKRFVIQVNLEIKKREKGTS